MTRCLILMLSLLLPYHVYASSEGSGETTLSHSLARVLAARICNVYQDHMLQFVARQNLRTLNSFISGQAEKMSRDKIDYKPFLSILKVLT